ncbi:MAG: 4Fe-4S dicluster domain-containing protein [Candidatus Methanomethylicia archaeon]
MPKIIVNERYCKGCEICMEICPKKVFEMSKELSSRGYHIAKPVRENECITCHQCELYCPDQAIAVLEEDHGERKK